MGFLDEGVGATGTTSLGLVAIARSGVPGYNRQGVARADGSRRPVISGDVAGGRDHRAYRVSTQGRGEYGPSGVKGEGLDGLLPWFPLLEGGNNHETVEDMIAELKARDRTDLLPYGWVFAGLVLDSSEDEAWLKERFTAMREFLEESPVYQWIVEAGGLRQLRQILVRRVQKRFPVLAPLAEERAALLEDLEVLNTTIDAIIDAETVEEVRRILEESIPH